MKILIKNGRLIDPAQRIDAKLNLLTANGIVASITQDEPEADFSGKTVMLASDLDLEGLDWTEYMVMSFRGVFDGGNKTISNFSFSSWACSRVT